MEKLYILDGLNICSYRKQKVSLAVLLTLVYELIQRNGNILCFFDGVTPHRLSQSVVSLYDQLLKRLPDHFTEITGGIQADEFLLLKADSTGAIIISNDRFRDYTARFAWLKSSPERLIKGTFVAGNVMVPSLGIDVPVTSDLNATVDRIVERLGSGSGTKKSRTRTKQAGKVVKLVGEHGFKRTYYDDKIVGRNELRGAHPREAVGTLEGSGFRLIFRNSRVLVKPLKGAFAVRLGRQLLTDDEYSLRIGTHTIQIGPIKLRLTVEQNSHYQV